MDVGEGQRLCRQSLPSPATTPHTQSHRGHQVPEGGGDVQNGSVLHLKHVDDGAKVVGDCDRDLRHRVRIQLPVLVDAQFALRVVVPTVVFDVDDRDEDGGGGADGLDEGLGGPAVTIRGGDHVGAVSLSQVLSHCSHVLVEVPYLGPRVRVVLILSYLREQSNSLSVEPSEQILDIFLNFTVFCHQIVRKV